MTRLITHPNGGKLDDIYETILSAHASLSTEDSHALNARLILILANHIGDKGVIADAVKAAARQ